MHKPEKPLPLRKDFGGHGKEGRKIGLKANFFRVKMNTDLRVCHYDVDVVKVPDLGRGLPKKLCEQVIQTFMKQYKNVIFKNCVGAYDSRKNIYTSSMIPFSVLPKGQRKKFEVEYLKPGGVGMDTFEVSLRFAQEIPLKNIELALRGQSMLDPTAIQALDVALMHGFKMNDAFTSVGRNFFAKHQERARELGQGKEIWFGFHQSLRACEGTMMLNIDVAATTFYKGQNLLDFAAQILFPLQRARRDGPPPQQRQMPPRIDDRQRKQLEKELKAVKVETQHGPHRRHYKIGRLQRNTAADMKFEHDGTKISVAKYFESQYRIRLQYPNLPLVLMLPTHKEIHLPMELCYVIGGEHYKKKLGPDATADMVRACAKPAPDREKTINFYARKNNYDRDETINGFGMKIQPKMVELDGRVLPARKMITKKGPKEVVTEPKRGAWQTDRSDYYAPQHVKKWGLYCAEGERFCDKNTLKDFVSKLQRGGKAVGMQIGAPTSVKYLRDPKDCDLAMNESIKNQCQIMVFVLGNRNGTPFYQKIKQLGDVRYGMRTQCITSNNVKRANGQLIGNVLLKINAKLNGTNNILKNPDGKPLLTKPTIILGADVTHPAPGDNSKPSIAAIVASMNAYASEYQPEIRVQGHRQEMIGSMEPGRSRHLELMVNQCLRKFYRATRNKPLHIVYYRDGVSEGQFQEVLRTELTQIRHACKSLDPSYRPKMTVIVCQKRHHARLFCQNSRDADGKSQNVPAGTIVDSVITHPTEFDFYLCSHAGIQGTSRPTHYHVLYNDEPLIQKSPDVLQGLTYNLCHLYQRCQRSVSIPAPVYYAHLCAYRAMVHLAEVEDDRSSTYSGDDDQTLSDGAAGGMQDRVTVSKRFLEVADNKYQHFM